MTSSGIEVTWAQCFKTFYYRSIIFVISWAFVLGKPSQLSLMFGCKARSLP